jgi:hypothetical protein
MMVTGSAGSEWRGRAITHLPAIGYMRLALRVAGRHSVYWAGRCLSTNAPHRESQSRSIHKRYLRQDPLSDERGTASIVPTFAAAPMPAFIQLGSACSSAVMT